MKKALLTLLLLALAILTGCEEADSTESESSDAVSDSGPLVKRNTSTEVWAVENAWADRDTPSAKKAGVAWAENSGLSWEEKYARWIETMETMPASGGWGTTITLTTPYGDKKLPGPTLECAEVAMMMRATFASWYKLPFYLRGWDAATRKSMFAGHFGFVNSNGDPVSPFPHFRDQYKDFEKSWKPGDAWPSDAKLRAKHLGGDDTVEFLKDATGEELGAGAYFDEIYLNKRTGHFMRLLLLYFGSVNLADGSNMFHLAPEATRAGDVLLERWQKKGIGHTIPVIRVTKPLEGKLAIEVATGSMPRRQPRYEDALSARRYFTMEETGGEGTASDGNEYAKLGGGIRRWRTPINKNGRWSNDVSADSKPSYISDSDTAAIAARPARFDEILVTGSPEETKAALVSVINNARQHLVEHPASCSARSNREKAFEDLYAIADKLGTTKTALDEELRVEADYSFAPLVYEESKTCCWNSTTPAMAEIVLDFARVEREEAEAAGECREPTVFKSRADGYKLWADHAKAMGREADWLAWSEDEPCAQKDVAEDTADELDATAFCSLP
ncbi:MAG: hypothetical protein IPG04_39105 [Polyangiaceae bacterium]|nr:hypothetical protein [Polyangiaceae bacterium]